MLDRVVRDFWKNIGLLNLVLLPFTIFYLIIFSLRLAKAKPAKVNAHVICVGNITAGGSGKTPFCLALGKHYIERGNKVAFISRGYKGQLSNKDKPVKVTSKHTFLDVGDEPLLLSQTAPTYICPNRYLAASMAVEEGAEVIIMDDGLQNFTLHQDEKIVVFDSEFFIGNGLLLPAGPLREPLNSMLDRCDSIVVVGDEVPKKIDGRDVMLYNPKIVNPEIVANTKFVLMSSIGNPNKFLKSAESLNIDNVKHFRFADHHIYTHKDLKRVIEFAKSKQCKVLTTSKDFVKIPDELKGNFEVLEIAINLF